MKASVTGGEWWQNGWFDLLEKNMGGTTAITKLWENGGGYIGLERRGEGQPFKYCIGMLCPLDTSVPEGFIFIDFEGCDLGTCWIYGKEKEVYNTGYCKGKLTENGMKLWQNGTGGVWS